ncbi:MAG: hypothetical protein R3C97_08655 [Geminicoccaceae bacterium]
MEPSRKGLGGKTLPLFLAGMFVLSGCAEDGGTASRNMSGASTAATEKPAPVDPMVEARRCGSALGMATRCNLLGDARDFAVLRKSVISRISERNPKSDSEMLAEAFDMATLDRLTVVRGCQVPDTRVGEVEKRFQSTLSACLRP